MKLTFSKTQKYTISAEKIIETKVEIIKVIDQICKQNNLQYFAFGNLLVGCVNYKDILPEAIYKNWDIGLLREDYDQLIHILRHIDGQNGIYLNDTYKKTKYPNELFSIGKQCKVECGDLSVEQPCWIQISPFDTVPEDFDFFCGYIRQTSKENKYYHKILRRFAKCNTKSKRLIARLRFFNDTPEKAFQRRNKAVSQFKDSEAQAYCRSIYKKGKVLKRNQLFPIQYLPFRDIELPCPSDYSMWTIPMTPELKKQTEEIQKVDLFVLSEFDRVCRLLGIGYFICGGTMLGYMRHGGFIPWDDDVDVGMLREDYERFLREAGQYLDKRCFLQTRESDPEIPYLFSKIRVNGTEYITNYNEHRNFHKGICLDLFPFDVLPEKEKEKRKFLAKTSFLVRVHNRFCNKGLPEPVNPSEAYTLKEKWYHFVGKMQRRLYKAMPLSITQRWYIRHVTKYNHLLNRKGNCTVASFVPSYTYIKTEDLLPYRDGKFEGITVMVPNKPEIFLTMQYGDFMEMPPLHSRNGHVLVRYKADIEL